MKNKGETLALVGETGAGKTTIAKAILGILPDPPAKVLGGKIWLDGEELLSMPEEKMLDIRGGKIAMIFPGSDDSIKSFDDSWRADYGRTASAQ